MNAMFLCCIWFIECWNDAISLCKSSIFAKWVAHKFSINMFLIIILPYYMMKNKDIMEALYLSLFLFFFVNSVIGRKSCFGKYFAMVISSYSVIFVFFGFFWTTKIFILIEVHWTSMYHIFLLLTNTCNFNILNW